MRKIDISKCFEDKNWIPCGPIKIFLLPRILSWNTGFGLHHCVSLAQYIHDFKVRIGWRALRTSLSSFKSGNIVKHHVSCVTKMTSDLRNVTSMLTNR